MEATQKRKMWKVAAVHFGITLFVLLIAFPFKVHFEPLDGSHYWLYWRVNFQMAVLQFLQPHLLALGHLETQITGKLLSANSMWIRAHYQNIIMVFGFAPMPIWSICFGWLYVKFTNWLNHFPILGKRVF